MIATIGADSIQVPVFQLCMALVVILITAIIIHKTGIHRTKTKAKDFTMAEAIKISNGDDMEHLGKESAPNNQDDIEEKMRKSALQDNIERKGKNAYYFAHANTANGPKWDGKAEPKLLHRESSCASSTQNQAFDYHKSNINSYAFLDEDAKVKIYVNLEGVGNKCSVENGDIKLDYSETTLQLTVNNYDADKVRYLCFGKLYGKIASAKFRTKEDKIIITMIKLDDDCKEWKSIGASSA